jgi:hypothetical protein
MIVHYLQRAMTRDRVATVSGDAPTAAEPAPPDASSETIASQRTRVRRDAALSKRRLPLILISIAAVTDSTPFGVGERGGDLPAEPLASDLAVQRIWATR